MEQNKAPNTIPGPGPPQSPALIGQPPVTHGPISQQGGMLGNPGTISQSSPVVISAANPILLTGSQMSPLNLTQPQPIMVQVCGLTLLGQSSRSLLNYMIRMQNVLPQI